MKKIFSLIATFCFAISMMAETEFTFTSAADINQTKDDITVVLAQGSNTQNGPAFRNEYYLSEYHPEMRLYLGNTITISSDENLTNIQMVFAKSGASNKEYTGLEASTGTLVSGGVSEDKTDWKVDRWTGSAKQVVFTLTGSKGQRQIQRILIDGDSIEINPVEDILPTAENLDANYEYAEPTEVLPKDTTILKKEYAFIHNNILVHCDMGSIIKATDTTDAYFNCNANYTITFTATKPIKGIEIDGYVRKAFDATCEPGEIEFFTDPDYEGEAWPVIVLRDVDDTSVTLSCPKQFRCYAARVFFETNPNHLDIDDIESNAPINKILRDGQLLILRGNKTYSASGVELK